MIRQALWALIIVTTVLHTVVGALAQDMTAALVSLGVGALWLALEIRGVRGVSWICFLVLITVAVLASMAGVAMPLILLALCSALAAWDLSAFRARTADVEESAAKATLERNHLRKLSITAGAGFVAALIPLFVQLSISFVALCLLLLVAIIALNNVVGSLINKRQSSE